ncbi:hypothetical protein GQ53DRAFT_778467 [Thozetella sp. PMI_491]|nr:hypothetical protein GQ53DRAFT_778467 [Thozetella sp. PMI_491]
MSEVDAKDTCNKSVALYVIPTPKISLLTTVLHNFIYRQWFRPYRSELGGKRFICKSIMPLDLEEESFPSQTTINSLKSLNEVICTDVEARRRVWKEEAETSNHAASPASPVQHQLAAHQKYILQPLFRALFIVVCSQDYQNEDSANVGRLPVLLVRTGIEDGLSAAITFNSIQQSIRRSVIQGEVVETTLEVAIGFVINLEAREASVFGLQPDPEALWKSDNGNSFAWWTKSRADEPPVGPSSRFVDEAKYTLWEGSGEEFDRKILPLIERRKFREARTAAGEFDSF